MPSPDAPHHRAPRDDDLPRRRREIGRGLKRSHYAAAVASGFVGLLALVALWLGAQAQHRAAEARVSQQKAEDNAAKARTASGRLWDLSRRTARQERLSRAAGQRIESLEFIQEAARLQPSRELRDEALSALLLPDIGTNLTWHSESGFEVAGAYDANLEHFILNNDRGRAIVRRTADSAPLMDTEGLGAGTSFWGFSPDGRLAAIAFRDAGDGTGEIGVWDWRQTNLLARLRTVTPHFGERLFEFSPDGRRLWALTSDGALARCDLATRRLETVIPPRSAARSVRLSPAEHLVAVACGSAVEVWDLASRTPRATLALTNEVWQLAWQPGEARLALGCYGALLLWDLGATDAVRLAEGRNVDVTDLFFNQDGDLLFVGGWQELGEIWDTRQLRRALEPGVGRLVQLSRDQNLVATCREKVGYGVREYRASLGVRSWLVPAPFAGEHRCADLDPRERWLLSAHPTGWLIRDAESGRELARAPCGTTLAVGFSVDGAEVRAWTPSGLHRWPLAFEEASGGLAVGSPVTVWSAGDSPPDFAVFAADRRHTSCVRNGGVTVLDLAKPAETVQFPQRSAGDNAHWLSPDGRWLITGHHNWPGLDWYDCRTGQWLRRIAERELLSGVAFEPARGRLFTCTGGGFCEWDPENGTLLQTHPWRAPTPHQLFHAFAPGGRLALAQSSPASFQLYDLKAGGDFATLDFRDPQAVRGGALEPRRPAPFPVRQRRRRDAGGPGGVAGGVGAPGPELVG